MSRVVAVHRSATHTFSKNSEPAIRLIEGLGVEGDAHAGVTVKHRSRVARDPTQPNLRQVHLMHAELIEELNTEGFAVAPGAMGENVTTSGVALLGLSAGTLLRLGGEAIVEITGLRNPCSQLNGLHGGLMNRLIEKRADGSLIRKAGIMGVVLRGGLVRAGDPIAIEEPATRRPLEPV